MSISIIVAYDDNRGIGYQGQLPWPVNSEDFARFKQLTLGNVVIMGRATWDSLPAGNKPLPYRLNGVVTSTGLPEMKRDVENIIFAYDSLLKAIAELTKRWKLDNDGEPEIFIIGGETIYQEALDFGLVDKIYATYIYGIHPADRHWNVLVNDWTITERNRLLNGTGEFLTIEKKV